jgi:septum formation protein
MALEAPPDGPRIVLASASPIRAALLRAAGVAIAVRPTAVDEAAVKQSARAEGMPPADTALLLAELKAARIADPEALVIGADQLLVCGEEWFDKPEDVAAARAQLGRLRGRTHALVTAVTCLRSGQPVWSHVATASLAMRSFSDAFLDAYLAAEAAYVTASVGAYRLEGPGVQLFESVQGDYHGILGLPLLPLLGFLRQHGALPG